LAGEVTLYSRRGKRILSSSVDKKLPNLTTKDAEIAKSV
jgi:hypothetical protein